MNEENVNVNIKIKIYNGKKFYVASIREYPDCVGQAETPEDAYNEVIENFNALIDYCKQSGKELTILKADEDYSGRVLLRIPKSLHRSLSLQAELEGISLNSFIVNSLSYRVSQVDFVKTLEKVILNMPLYIQKNELRFKLPSTGEFSRKLEVPYNA